MMTPEQAQAAVDTKTTALLDRLVEDNEHHGGLLDRGTIRAADELRIALAVRNKARSPSAPVEAQP